VTDNLHIHQTEIYNHHTREIPCTKCAWGHPPVTPVTTRDLEHLLDTKIKSHQAWEKALIHATEINGVENLAERARRDVLAHEAYTAKCADEQAYNSAIQTYVDQKRRKAG
jgi:hypothetical protein